MSGPFETEAEARAAALRTTRGRDHRMTIESANVAELAAACSGIELGAYDQRIIGWLAGWAPGTVAVVCGLISRARQAAAPAEPEGGRLAAIRGVLAEFDWSRGDIADLQGMLERIEQLANSSRTESGIEPGGGACLTPGDVLTVLHALSVAADASRYRVAMCTDCDAYRADCARCGELLAQAAGYDALAVKLGGES